MNSFSGVRRRALKFGVVALAGHVLSSCAGLVGTRRVELPLARLQDGLERRFPYQRRLLAVFDIALSRPQLAILPADGRLALTMDAAVGLPLIQQNWRGSLTVSGRLVVDAAREAVVMSEARVDRLAFEGANQARQRQLAEVANWVADRLILDMPLYRFRPEDLHFAGVQFVPTLINLTAGALVMSFEPVGARRAAP